VSWDLWHQETGANLGGLLDHPAASEGRVLIKGVWLYAIIINESAWNCISLIPPIKEMRKRAFFNSYTQL
jgi:hypothetical protein